ncbi:hypothetical protein DH2020_019795 [Rehmannia glutinosa]|uniref:Uncharacterized protein n=1 Tax=Rehmannia glutinosa TaxID=99300 RepID=A0ABR0WE82_REHGL
MAYEFFTKGTLFGLKFDPTRAGFFPVNTAEVKRNRHGQFNKEAKPSGKSKPQSYSEVANLLKSDGVHILGVVNPSQLARWIHMLTFLHTWKDLIRRYLLVHTNNVTQFP